VGVGYTAWAFTISLGFDKGQNVGSVPFSDLKGLADRHTVAIEFNLLSAAQMQNSSFVICHNFKCLMLLKMKILLSLWLVECLPVIPFHIFDNLGPDKIDPAALFVTRQAPVHPIMQCNEGNAEYARYLLST
jgi:hypothetical protein